MKKHWRWLLLAAVAIAVIAFFALGFGHYLSLDSIKQEQGRLEAWRKAQPVLSAAAFFALYVAVTALSIPGAAVLTLAAGAVFGLVEGTLIASFAASIGATVAMLLSRLVLHDWVQARFGERLKPLQDNMKKDGAFYLFTLRLVPGVPFFLINLAMGLTGIGVVTFYIVSQLGMLLGTIVYVNAGTRLAAIDSLSDVASPALLGSLLLLGIAPLLAKKGLDIYRSRRRTSQWKRPGRYERNLVVIGAGSAGLVAAYIAAALKAKVTLVERASMGGDCLNTGCVPSKALIRSARLLADIARSAELGVPGAQAEVDFAAVMERVQRIVGEVAPHDSVERYQGLGVDVVHGVARITTPWEVEITRDDGTTKRLSTRSIVVATGAEPVVPDIAGIESSGYLTSETIWSLRKLPARFVVLGGGPIGAELAQAFSRLGSKVTIVESGEQLLSREDGDVGALMASRFAADDIDLRLGHKAVRFESSGDKRALIADHDGKEVRLPFDAVLVAVGRKARMKGFGLEALGIDCGKTVGADDFLRTSVPNIFVAGDVAGPWQFTHTAAYQAWYAAVNALFDPFWTLRISDRVIPAATFTEPEVARVGLNEREAKERKIDVEVTRYELAELDRAIAESATEGFVKVLTPPGKDKILGVTIVGADAGNLIAEYVLAMKHGLGLGKVLGTIHIYPTMAEANKNAAAEWRKAHVPQRLLAVAERFHAWRRG